jgi:tRNA-uridine 2-sulfurtransferase
METVVIGLSGGVDSSVSALLLKQQGYNVIGLFMKNWEEDETLHHCPAEQDLNDVKAICQRLEIPLHTINFAQEYWQRVFSLFLEEYQQGRTPNPDILCNKEIKFKAFLEHARQLGADKIAMGHYVQTDCDPKTGKVRLLRGSDPNKDQSYFLYTLGQAELSASLFPVGHLPKATVRQLAKDADLVNHAKKDSTGICFIGERKFKSFLAEFLPAKPGIMVTPHGEKIGDHTGLMFYTLGQRQGLLIGGRKGAKESPWYVVAKDLENNRLVITQNVEHPWHFSRELAAKACYWVDNAPPAHSFFCTAKVRYRQHDVACEVIIQEDIVNVIFKEPQKAVTPGQSIVFYQNEVCLGGGIIHSTDSLGGLNAKPIHHGHLAVGRTLSISHR